MAVQSENEKHQKVIKRKMQAQRKAQGGLNNILGDSASQTSDISPRN